MLQKHLIELKPLLTVLLENYFSEHVETRILQNLQLALSVGILRSGIKKTLTI